MGRTALIAGATGLVGGRLLRLLLEEPAYERVTALVRRRLPHEHPKLTQVEADFDRPESYAAAAGAEHVFCCVGTTMSSAHNQEAFYAVDFDIPYELARAASQRGAGRFLLVSSSGADPRSRLFYSRVKGEIEQAVARLPFQAVHLLRPSLLLGERGKARPLEAAAQAVLPRLAFLMVGPFRRFRPIRAEAVARAMVRLALEGETGVRVWESDRLQALADGVPLV